MAMMDSKVRKSYRNETARSAEVKGKADEKYSKSIARNASKLTAYKAGYELGKAGVDFSSALWQYQKTLPLSMTSKEHDAFVSGHWAGENGNESEF